MKTDEEIIAKIALVKELEVFGWSLGDLIECLSFDAAKAAGYVADDVTEEERKSFGKSREPEDVKARMVEYLAFAWDKALGHRGLSAGRSIDHIRNWVWLIGDCDALDFVNNEDNYPQYGVPILKYISERYGYDYPKGEAVDNMSKGLPCQTEYDCGCGS